MSGLAVGDVIDGRYELEAMIGKGGMGAVFRARHTITHGRVALKILTDTVDAETTQRFLAEARAAAMIGHPAIVAVNDANRTADGRLYLVMELLAGKPLRIAMHAGLPADQIRRIGLEILDALGAAHARGFVHRDLKPENIFVLAGTGTIKVLDFGIAKVLGAAGMTSFGNVLGTIEYMAPEQLVDAGSVDGRADLWAVGVMLYELIAGVRPYGGPTREARYAALASEEPMPIGDVVPVGPDVASFFAQALARDPARRFQTAAAMAAALRPLVLASGTAAFATSPGPTLASGAVPAHVGATLTTGAQPLGHTPPMMVPSAPPAPRRTGLWLALVAGVVASGAIGFGIVMATRVRASEAPIDASVVIAGDAAVITVASGCKSHCTRLANCELAPSTCVGECETNTGARACFDRAKTCDELAACYWVTRCGRPVKADPGFDCFNALQCHSLRNGNTVEQCRCYDSTGPVALTLLAQFVICQNDITAEAIRAQEEKRPFDYGEEYTRRCTRSVTACQANKSLELKP